MKVLSVLVVAVLAVFLVCDPQMGVTQYQVEVNGTVDTTTYPAQPDGSMKVALDGYSPGNYTFRARAADDNNWWSDWSNPFSATKPGSSGNVRIVQE